MNKMKDDEEFNVMFVLVIEKHEILYNYKLEKYANRNAKELAWQQVAIEVKCTVEECKKRWRMLRISLLRHLRESKKVSGSSGKKKKPFYLEDTMKYLIPYTKSRHQTGNAESDEDEVCDNQPQMEDSQTYGNEEESVDSSNIENNDIEEEVNDIGTSHLLERTVSSVPTDLPKKNPQRFSSKKRKIESTQNWENSAVKCLNALSNKYNVNTEKTELSVEEDADLLFLKSLLPDLKKLNDAQKRKFKNRIFVLYDDILNEDCARSTVQIPLQSPYSSAVSVSSYDSNIQYSSDNGKQYADLVNATVFP